MSPRLVPSDSRPIKLKHRYGSPRSAISCQHASMEKYNVHKRKTKVTHPFYFTKGSLIQLASGELKQVENLETMDFFQQSRHSNMQLEVSTVEDICRKSDQDSCLMTFVVGDERNQVRYELKFEYYVTLRHKFEYYVTSRHKIEYYFAHLNFVIHR